MENTFLDLVKRFKHLTPSDLYELYKITRLTRFKSGELIIREGDFYNYIIGISKGLVRTYVVTADGDERTTRFAKEKQFSGSANCIINNKASFEYLEALEDTYTIKVDLNELKKLAENNIRILKLWNEAIIDAFSDSIDRIQFLTTLSPEQRYRHLLDNNPSLVHRVQQKHLASYLGITTVSLSRIRSRIIKT